MKIYTIQLAQWRLAKKLGIRLLDTTVKSGCFEVAPSWDMVSGSKNGTLSPEAYTTLYDRVIERSQVKYPEFWAALLDHSEIALACYCRPGVFCHRHLLAKHLRKYAESNGVSCEPAGELIAN
jgi:uncharacterized protein YeaO (DUF488 family)